MTRLGQGVVPLISAQEFERRVKDYARFGHMVRIIDHVTKDRSDRRITRPMIMRTLRKGQIFGTPEYDREHNTWVGKMRRIGTGIDMTAVCAIQDGVLIVTVVTVYGKPAP